MKYVFLLLLICFSVLSYASPDSQLIETIKQKCEWSNKKISVNDKMDCMTDHINCAIVRDGEIDLTKITEVCLNKKSKGRANGQQRK